MNPKVVGSSPAPATKGILRLTTTTVVSFCNILISTLSGIWSHFSVKNDSQMTLKNAILKHMLTIQMLMLIWLQRFLFFQNLRPSSYEVHREYNFIEVTLLNMVQ